MSRPAFAAILLLPLLLSGCAMQWQAHWSDIGAGRAGSSAVELVREADACYDGAGDGAAVDRCLGLYETALLEDPGNYAARVRAASLRTLKGTAYTTASGEKSREFLAAMRHAELAMYTNADFRKLADAGVPPWEAVGNLDAREAEAMFFWATALQYEFKEGMSLPSKVVNIGWMERALTVLDRVEAVSPTFGGGGVEFGKVICYYVLPESRSGSRTKGDLYMRKALAKGTGWLFPRWASGKYYLPAQGDRKGAAEELAWVAAQDPARAMDPYPWRVHFQEDARRMLAEDR